MIAFVFFFQAEDGIRDVAVTGVQTCALPICRARIRRWTASASRPTTAVAAPQVTKVADAPTACTSGAPSKIGRASCRERVLISVVAVLFKKKVGTICVDRVWIGPEEHP